MVDQPAQPHIKAPATVEAWILAGGEGRRMGGLDKGLVKHQGQPLVKSVLDRVGPACPRVSIIANRHLSDYAALLGAAASEHGLRTQARPDAPDLPAGSGPMAGVLTALRHSEAPWVWLSPCDTPRLPSDLLQRLMATAQQDDADVVVAMTQESPCEQRHHWLCCLINRRVLPQTEESFMKGERKIGRWIQSLRWRTVSFERPEDFMNINTLEARHGRD